MAEPLVAANQTRRTKGEVWVYFGGDLVHGRPGSRQSLPGCSQTAMDCEKFWARGPRLVGRVRVLRLFSPGAPSVRSTGECAREGGGCD